jgi:hypothetical protein
MKTNDVFQVPAGTPLAEELASDDVVEMANLTTAQTGVTGTIFISTSMGGHGPRVEYFPQPGRSQPSFSVTISDAPGERRTTGGGGDKPSQRRAREILYSAFVQHRTTRALAYRASEAYNNLTIGRAPT